MSSSLLCFRTITRMGIFRQVKLPSGGKSLVPIALAAQPESVSLNPGDEITEVTETACDGRQVIAFSYAKGSKPELEISFGLAVSQLESLLHGKIVATGTNTKTMVFAEYLPVDTNPTPARNAGEIGHGAAAPSATATSDPLNNAYAYVVDPATKLARPLTIGSDIQIGADLTLTATQALVDAGDTIYAWVPATLPSATVITAQPLGLVSVFAAGINFDGTARSLIARNCSRLSGGAISSEPKRDIKLRILPDPADGTGLGYQLIDTALQMVC